MTVSENFFEGSQGIDFWALAKALRRNIFLKLKNGVKLLKFENRNPLRRHRIR